MVGDGRCWVVGTGGVGCCDERCLGVVMGGVGVVGRSV